MLQKLSLSMMLEFHAAGIYSMLLEFHAAEINCMLLELHK